ncbi:ROK family protein [Sphingomonas sp. H39-1-10]|uniref:ROK family protein n=1 Tax=Sphingomonas TaxID=13687 RepID=UPI000891DFA3|nr:MULTISPECIES: ROK family protein [Sphingomonas]MDF0487890.1 ROK family protein [Sphingomonas pollutisoli]SDA24583.1 fructokinase [Sphingomonas sp. NFR15]
MKRIAGVELGGTKCIVVLANGDDRIAEQHVIPTLDPATTLAAIIETLDRWWGDGRFDALGIASFGPLDLDISSPAYGTITSTAKPGWRDTPIVAPLAARYAVPVAFDTDVNGAAFAERRWGAGQGLDDLAYVTVGTGVGVGLIVNGQATRGLGHCEAGHMRVARLAGDHWRGACPYHGDCVEGLAAGPAIAARLGRDGASVPDDDPVWDTVVEAVAQMLQALVSIAGPRRILIGGGVMASRPLLIERIEARVRALVGRYLALPAERFVRSPGLGAEAGPLGPIALALAMAERDRTSAIDTHASPLPNFN